TRTHGTRGTDATPGGAMARRQDDRERSSPGSRSPQHTETHAPVGGALTPIRDRMPTPVAPRPPNPAPTLSHTFPVIMGWGDTFQGQGNEWDPQNQQNLVLSYQIALLAQDAKGQWRYGEDIYQPNTSQAERFTLGQLLWFGLQCVQIGYRSAQGRRILLVA